MKNRNVEYEDSYSLLKIFLIYLLCCAAILGLGVLCANNPALGAAVAIAAIVIGAKIIDFNVRKKIESPPVS